MSALFVGTSALLVGVSLLLYFKWTKTKKMKSSGNKLYHNASSPIKHERRASLPPVLQSKSPQLVKVQEMLGKKKPRGNSPPRKESQEIGIFNLEIKELNMEEIFE